MFRAGHAYAGELVVLAIVAQSLVDSVNVATFTENFLRRIGFPVSAILVSGGFFASASGNNVVKPNSYIVILYLGVVLLGLVSIFPVIVLLKSAII
ncbi:MAG TPA: hypothetical protein VNV85_17290 [Puia sp.]|jgi:hypothetical protein|nr:hypothetical protein [Puia sp.]